MPRKKKERPKGKQQGRALSPVQKEQIRQTFMLTGNKRETGRLCSVSEKTVYNVLNEPEEPEAIKARERAALMLAGKVHAKADRVLDAITEDDLESGYLKDEDGNLVFDKMGRPIWMGPTLNQKTVSAAILADKLPVLQQYRQQLSGGTEGMGQLPAPESIQALVAGIKGKLRSLSIIDVQFEKGNDEIKQRADELLSKAQMEIETPIEAEYTTLDALDNPGVANEAAHDGDKGVSHEDSPGA